MIANFSGSGNGITDRFTTNGPWQAQFTGRAAFVVMSSEGAAEESTGAKPGTYWSSKSGTFYFQVTAQGVWTVCVVFCRQVPR
ncbi:MAG TPA: hypothetical protein VNU00_06165 [Candidatus Binataceae bacterium]|nr:hypothetical protein [Candidatus Binataceae bacterium]